MWRADCSSRLSTTGELRAWKKTDGRCVVQKEEHEASFCE